MCKNCWLSFVSLNWQPSTQSSLKICLPLGKWEGSTCPYVIGTLIGAKNVSNQSYTVTKVSHWYVTYMHAYFLYYFCVYLYFNGLILRWTFANTQYNIYSISYVFLINLQIVKSTISPKLRCVFSLTLSMRIYLIFWHLSDCLTYLPWLSYAHKSRRCHAVVSWMKMTEYTRNLPKNQWMILCSSSLAYMVLTY